MVKYVLLHAVCEASSEDYNLNLLTYFMLKVKLFKNF